MNIKNKVPKINIYKVIAYAIVLFIIIFSLRQCYNNKVTETKSSQHLN